MAPLCTAGFTDSHWMRDAFGTVAYGFFPSRDRHRARLAAHPLGGRARAGRRSRARRRLSALHGARRLRVDSGDAGAARRGGAFEALEEYLAEDLRPGVVADLYLGYGLSPRCAASRRPHRPSRAALPLAACRIRREAEAVPAGHGTFRAGEWEQTWATTTTPPGSRRCATAIARGDVYQVNLVQHLSAPFEGEPAGLAAPLAPLRPLDPRPFVGDGWAIVSASPELFLARRGDRLRDDADQGHAPGGRGRRRPEGRRRARDDRRPRAQRPLARLRAGQRSAGPS